MAGRVVASSESVANWALRVNKRLGSQLKLKSIIVLLMTLQVVHLGPSLPIGLRPSVLTVRMLSRTFGHLILVLVYNGL